LEEENAESLIGNPNSAIRNRPARPLTQAVLTYVRLGRRDIFTKTQLPFCFM
jgi:hypothetical protein